MKQISRFQIPNSKFLLVLAVLALFTSLPVSIQAQESSPSGSIADKINALKQDIASRAAQLKTEITRKVQNKAIIGTILEVRDSEIIIETLDSTKTVKYDEFTQARGLKNKEIKIETLEAGDKIAALGDMDDKNNLITQRVVFLENFASNSAELVWGQIQKAQGASLTIQNKSGTTEIITTNSQTQFFLGNEEASIIDAKVEKHLLARGTRQKDGSLRAKFIYFIPSSGFTKPVEKSPIRNASPSASPKN